jgi:hypothetical protein
MGALLKSLDALGITATEFATLCDISIDDVAAWDAGSADVLPRHLAILRLCRGAGKAKLRSIIASLATSNPYRDWRVIPGFESYDVNNLGMIRRYVAGSRGTRVLKQSPVPSGYLKVNLYNDEGRMCTVQVHRAVCLAWHGIPPSDKQMACHRNGDKTDNRSANLYWGDPKDNAQDSVRHGSNYFATPERFVQDQYMRNSVFKVRKAHKLGLINREQALAEIIALKKQS